MLPIIKYTNKLTKSSRLTDNEQFRFHWLERVLRGETETLIASVGQRLQSFTFGNSLSFLQHCLTKIKN